MAKPILVAHYCISGISDDLIVKNLKHIAEICKRVTEDTYYVFALPTTKDSYIQVFYDKDFIDIKYNELSDKLLTQINKINEKN